MARGLRPTSRLYIDYDRCQACDDCTAKSKCRGGGFRIIDKGEAPVLDTSYCWGCFLCVHACPHGAVVHEDPSQKDDGDPGTAAV